MKPDIKGVEVHWWREDSFELAQYLRKHLADDKNLKKWDTLDRGLFKSQFYVINHTTMPAILIEVGFMSNKDELKNLKNKKVQKEMAEAITEGILEYLKKRGK
jgi:N-acetylmuramoyl-L-alanine amidase